MSSHELGEKGVAIVGGGLVGCLLGIYLTRQGFKVHIFEARGDIRKDAEGGRSINLVITSRGINALTSLSHELAAKVMGITVPVFGRTLHNTTGECAYQPYGPNKTYCNFSVSRAGLNCTLMDAAEEAGCVFYFSHPLAHVDVPNAKLFFYQRNAANGQLYQHAVTAKHIFGTDGGGSRCRQALKGLLADRSDDISLPLYYGYKELIMPLKNGAPPLDITSLHIWPRGSHFLMALPNLDGSFTMTLYMNETGPMSFQSLDSSAKIEKYFEEFYPDALALMPEAIRDFQRNPVGFLGTVLMTPWAYEDKLLLLGDAAHAITPFFGQGCNAGFEDVFEFAQFLSSSSPHLDMKQIFSGLYLLRKVNADAIAHMALENFTEMMSKTADRRFLLEKDIEIAIAQRFPLYVSRYVLVTHSLVPYHVCKLIGEAQQQILSQLSANISSIDQVDFSLAERLINQKLIPLYSAHRLTPEQFLYTSPYYPQAKL